MKPSTALMLAAIFVPAFEYTVRDVLGLPWDGGRMFQAALLATGAIVLKATEQ